MKISKVLRQKAEELHRMKQSETKTPLAEVEILRLIQELEIHQIELELQNDELIIANERAAELAADKYIELYDFAPSGYFTLSKKGVITEVNLFGATMLGKVRTAIKNSDFKFYLSDDSVIIFNKFLEKVFVTKVRETCDLTLSTIGMLPVYIQLTGIANENGKQCLVTAVDITERKLAEQALLYANIELAFQNEEKAKRADELLMANKELAFQNEEKAKRAEELIIANKELAFQNEEKSKRAAELLIANIELTFQSEEKAKRADELLIANIELAFQSEEKAKRADELLIANIELAFQNEEKAKRAAEMVIARKEIAYQEELLVANSYLENLIDNANAPIIIWDPQFRISRFNHAFELLTGLSEVEAIGQPLEILFPPKFAANSMAQIRKTQNGEKLETDEIEIQHCNGSVRVVLWNSATVFEPDGQTPIATLAQGQDITDRIRFEHQLEDRLKELQTLYNLTRLTNREDAVIESLAQEMVVFIPKGWQYSEIACCRIVIDGFGFCSDNFQDTPWKQSAPISVSGETIGLIEVAYLRNMPNEAEGPFLHEERLLINSIAEHLQQSILRIRNQIGLQENKLRLEKAMQVAKMAWMEVDLVRGNVVFDKGRAEILGYDVEKIISFKDYLKFVYPDDLNSLKATVGNHLKGHSEKYEIEYRRWIHPIGYKWFSDIGSVVERGQDGAPIKFASLTMDITDRKIAEQERARQSQLITMLLDSIPDLIFYKDTEGVFLGCNPPFAALVGKTKDEIIGKTDYDLVDKEIADFFRLKDVEMLEQNLPRHNEEWVTYPDGRKVLLDTLKTPYWSGDGTLIGIMGISRDLTARNEADKKLRESEERFERLSDHSRVITWEVDANGLITYMSNTCLTVLGYQPEELIGKKYFYDLHPEDGREVFKVGALKIFERKEFIRNLENQVQSKDGPIFWVTTNGMPILDENGRLCGYGGTDTDISERKSAENALQQASARLSLATRAGGVGVWDYDLANDQFLWDAQMLSLYGIEKENFVWAYQTWLSCLHPDDVTRANVEIQMAIRDELDFDTEFRVVWPDGSVHYIKALAIVQHDGSGIPVSMIGTNWDITNQKKIEQTLLERDARYNAILNASPDVITVTDLKGQILLTSPVSLKMFGYGSSDVKNHSIYDYLVKKEYTKAQENIAKVFLGIPHDSVEYKAIRADGSTFDIEINVEIVRDTEGEPFQMVFVTRDITKRKQADKKHRESEKRYRLLVETAQEGILVAQKGFLKLVNPILTEMTGYSEEELYSIPFLEFVHPYDRDLVKDNYLKRISDIEVDKRYHLRILRKDKSILWVELSGIKIDWEGHPATLNFITDITGRKKAEDQIVKLAKGIEQSPASIVITDINGVIEFVNPKFCQLSGYTIQEAIGNNPRFLKSGHTTQEYYQDLWKTILTGKEWHGKFHNKKKNGEFYWEMASISPIINAKGEITNFIAVKEDITKEKKTADALLKAKQEAEAANKAKSAFLANMSHEIRTPLNAIIGFSQLMNRDKLLTDSQKEYSFSINRAGEHLLSLINDILELSKVEAGRVVLNPTNFDLWVLLKDLQIIFKERTQSKHLKLLFENATELPRFIFADESKLRQIFINLIGNAVKFTNEGGITIKTSIAKVDEDKIKLIVDIIDTGHGIAENELDKLFKNFEQTTSGIKQGTGTGLGLALSRELAILMGGNITVASEVGKGTVFTFNIEFKTGTEEEAETKINNRIIGIEKPQKAYRILVVDDKEENLKVAVNFLRLVGFETEEAANGEQAIIKFEEWNPDLVLMDLRMPVIDGYEATRRIKSTEKGKQTPIVALTASLFEDENIKLESLGLQGYIRKPYTENELFGTIGKVLGIQYLYENETPLSHSKYLYDDVAVIEEIAKLPGDRLSEMRDAVSVADSDALIELVNSSDQVNSELAQLLISVANNFDWGYLQRIFSKNA